MYLIKVKSNFSEKDCNLANMDMHLLQTKKGTP